jgi:DNA-binding LytR/AlgR family response regulator
VKVLIVEDEALAAERLRLLVNKCDPDAVVVDHFDSVEDTVKFFMAGRKVDLLLLDIQLADGKSFEIFEKVTVSVPVIFTTAFDEYALQAFRFLSVDYLLKPIQQEHLCTALAKYKTLGGKFLPMDELNKLKELILSDRKSYKERFLIKAGNKLLFKNTDEVAYFYADGKVVYLVSRADRRRFVVDHTLEELEEVLNPQDFFRISRKFIVSIHCLAEVKGLLSGKLELKLNMPCEHELLVSRDRSSIFKQWLNN